MAFVFLILGFFIIPPANCVCGEVHCFHIVRPSVCPVVRDVLVFLCYLEKAMMEIHQILRTH